ncbi:hypothetical protein FVE88_22200 [Ectopseudomonas mendocina]|uniref:hypothetical protein n=1 Tax=Ectopseudomonas oleovorans TaxID=301 RepID=UPI0011C7D39D|nr:MULTISPECIES: hypothetical protein [Pseudomonas aeruginosa group]MDG9979406.1 hypothetical protein [Pseudomonas oleovorans]TXR32731.1 hypothetical protein FVE88_22200 [Pseudomonas mendocina]
MDNDLDQAMNWIEIIKAAGPYIVAVAGMAFGFFQSKRVAEIAKEKDIQLAKLQKQSLFLLEKHKAQITATLRLQEIYSSMFAKVESVFHNYCGLISGVRGAGSIQEDLIKFVVDDYESLSVESRKAVLAEAIAICQIMQDHKAYELAVKLDSKITEALSLIDFSGNSSGSEHLENLKRVQREYGLLYVSFFYRVANLESAANKSSNTDAASCTGS